MQGFQAGVAATLKATLDKLRKMTTGIVPQSHRLHDDFAFIYNGWYINAHARREGLLPDMDTTKIRLLFDDPEMAGLDGCPYMARLNYSMDLTREYRFCAFLHPRTSETVEDLKTWAFDRGFVNVSILNDGNALAKWDHAHRLEAMG